MRQFVSRVVALPQALTLNSAIRGSLMQPLEQLAPNGHWRHPCEHAIDDVPFDSRQISGLRINLHRMGRANQENN
jgi:hypothetical protein